MGWVAARIQDRELELLDLQLHPLLSAQGVKKWPGYRPRRPEVRTSKGGGLAGFLAAHKITVKQERVLGPAESSVAKAPGARGDGPGGASEPGGGREEGGGGSTP